MKSIWPPTPSTCAGRSSRRTTWPVRSISIAELMAVIRLNRTDHVRVVREVDRAHLDHRVVVRRSRTGAACPSGTRSRACPRLRSLRAPVTTPASTRSTTASVNISVWMPRSCLSRSASAARPGCAPMPSWSVAPSGHEVGDEVADAPLDLAELGRPRARRAARRPRRARSIWLDVDEAVAERPRHRAVELRDDRLRGPDRGVHRLDRRPERAEPVARRAASR